MSTSRYWTVVALLTLGVTALYARGDGDLVPASTPLAEFPARLNDWTSREVPIDPDTLEILGQGFFLHRMYTPPEQASAPAPGAAAPIDLFIAYFPTQRTGQSIHSPQNCLPGSGWVFESSGQTSVTDTTGKTSRVGDYLIASGSSKAEVLYWYQSHGRAIANDYEAKMDMLFDSIRYRRSDAALVRIVAPVLPGESSDSARQRAVAFARQLIPMLPAYIPN